MSSVILSRYNNKRRSALTIKKRSQSSTALQKLAYHTSRYQTLEPISEAPSTLSKSKSMNFDDPVDEIGIPSTLMTVQQVHQKHHKDLQLPDLQPLPSNIDSNSISLLEQKLELCCNLCDYTDVDVDRQAKATKTRTLKELINIFESSTTVNSLPSSVIDKFFNMIYVNLNRGLPAIPKKYLFYDDEPILVDIAWAHLSLVYQLLLDYQKISPTDKRFDKNFMNLIYSLLHAPDGNERSSIVTFLTTYLDTYPDKETEVMDILANCLIGYRDKVYDPFCVIPSLRIFQARFSLKTEIDEKHLNYFYRAILPMHSSKHIFSFYGYLTEIIGFFISLRSDLSITIFHNVLKFFPEVRPSKQILFINLITFIVERVPPESFETIIEPLFSLLARCSQSSHYKVVNSSFQIWGNNTILPMILDNTRAIYPIVYPWFNKTMKEHWSVRSQNAALSTLKSMHDTDPFMFDELSQNQNGANNKNKQQQQQPVVPLIDPHAAQLHKNWAMVARAAAKVDKNVNLAKILADIQVRFNSNPQNDKQMAKKKPNSSAPNLTTQSGSPQIVSPLVRRMY